MTTVPRGSPGSAPTAALPRAGIRGRLQPARLLAALRPEATERLDLPAEIVRESRRRVRVAALLGAAAYAAFLSLELTGTIPSSALERRIDLAHDGLGLGLCLLLAGIASVGRLSDRIVLGTALAFQIALSALIAFAHSWAAFVRTGHVPGLTWVVPVILVYPLLVPAPPRVALGFSLLCAATMPAALGVLQGLGAIDVAPADYLATGLTCLVAVGLSFVLSRTVHGAGRQLAAARMAGSYELIEPIAEGGMGQVWKARHLFLARPAAVKRILPERLQGPSEQRESVLERFTREARVTASLRSPHTVELFDFGMSDDGSLYYAMELLEGIDAERFVYRFGALEPRRAVHWLRQACHSLGEAHARGLLHRDIKPANLFLCRNGRDADWVKVLDFGLARPVAGSGEDRITRPGVVVGTPGYLAPEQILGEATDPRTDLYALGCVAWFLLAGERPFESRDTRDLLRMHVHEPPPSFASRGGRPVPPALETLIRSCLAKQPGARPLDADALDQRLAECLDDEPWSHAAASDWWRENLAG